MSDMIERIAVAIAESRFPNIGWDHMERWVQNDAMHEARVVIKAMREPTLRMVDSGVKMQMEGVDNIWRVMIDGALDDQDV